MTVVELMETVLPGNDRRVVKLAQSKLEEMGVEFHLGDAVESVERSEHGRMLSTLRSGAVIESEIVMSAVGRVPNSADLGFSEVGLRLRPPRAQGRRALPHQRARASTRSATSSAG